MTYIYNQFPISGDENLTLTLHMFGQISYSIWNQVSASLLIESYPNPLIRAVQSQLRRSLEQRKHS
jgi:hypothetical protein